MTNFGWKLISVLFYKITITQLQKLTIPKSWFIWTFRVNQDKNWAKTVQQKVDPTYNCAWLGCSYMMLCIEKKSATIFCNTEATIEEHAAVPVSLLNDGTTLHTGARSHRWCFPENKSLKNRIKSGKNGPKSPISNFWVKIRISVISGKVY